METALSRLRATAPDRDLSQLEPHVWARLAEHEGPAPILGLRAVAFAAVLALGLLAGARSQTANAADMAPFSAHASLAPSTLLQGGK